MHVNVRNKEKAAITRSSNWCQFCTRA